MSNRYKGGVISATPPTTTGGNDGVASGAWTLEQQMQLQAAGLWPNQPIYYIEDVFSTYLYTGTGSAQTITNGLNLSGKGGLVWLKGRDLSWNHTLYDTVNGVGIGPLNTADTAAPNPANNQRVTAFNSNGFTLGTNANVNGSGYTYVSWTFREQPKFFDIVTYTGNGTAGRTIAHNLGSAPGFMVVKSTSQASTWAVYHRSIDVSQYVLALNTTDAQFGQGYWNYTAPTSSVFTVGSSGDTNQSGQTYVAYLFAHDAGGFGLTGTDNVISCGSYTGNGSTTGPVINIGYEPQWLLLKQSSASGASWFLLDNMRGVTADGLDQRLFANESAAEGSDTRIAFNATGFQPRSGSPEVNDSGATYIYIAIRRGPMKVPTSGTSVFALGGTSSSTLTTSFAVDAFIQNSLSSSASNSRFASRLQGSNRRLVTSNTDAEAADSGDSQFNGASYTVVGAGSGIVYGYGRAPSFFDEVCYTGTGVARTVTHNLAAVPELMIIKVRSPTGYAWRVYAAPLGNTKSLVLNTDAAEEVDTYWNNTTPTSSVFSVNNYGQVNVSGGTLVAYLFATCAGVSKVGSYTGTGTTQTINCGFTAGSRFVMIKRTDSTGDWYVWDSARGIIAGNDPYILLNSTAAQVTGTDYIDTAATGFEISSTAPAAINANGGTFIFLAIA